MNNYLKWDIILSPGDNQWHLYLSDGVTPLIEALRSENELIHFGLALNRHEQPSIFVCLLVKTFSVDDVLNRIDFQFSNFGDLLKKHTNDGPIHNVRQVVGSDNVIPRDEPNGSITKAVSYAMLEALSQEEVDDDLIFTFGVYLLFATYANCSAASPVVAEAVYENFMAETAAATLATDRIFQRVKYHVMKPALDVAHEEISRSKNDNAIWLQNFTNIITVVLAKVENEAEFISLFMAISDSLKYRLDLGETQLNLLNYFVFQTLLKPKPDNAFIRDGILNRSSAKRAPKRSNFSKIPLLTYYSPSHKSLFDNFFYPSYQQHLANNFELVVLNGKQLCAALFEEDNWNEQVKEKIIFVNEFINSTDSKYIVFSDVDIIFYKNIYKELMEELNGHDMAFQNDSLQGLTNNLCSGFYCCRINESTKAFFKKMVDEYRDDLSDQQNLNLLVPQVKRLKYKALSSRFYNFSHADGRIWFNNKKIAFPRHPIIMYHANYTVGTENKEFLLQTFKEWDNKVF